MDGVGSYLLLRAERVTLGRAESSANPDIALPADLEGAHAHVLRVDHDYFLVPRGPALVNNTPITRHLLRRSRSCQDVGRHAARDVGQTKITPGVPIGQSLVVEPE